MYLILQSLLLLTSTHAQFPTQQVSPRSLKSSEYNASVVRWEWAPPLGPLTGHPKGAYLNTSTGAEVWYATYGEMTSGQTPVLLLHGGQGNSNQMFHQANKLAHTRQVIVQDTRGEGRSPLAGFDKFHYDDIARDALELLDHLKIPKVAVVGWSDGAITGLNLAMNYTDRIDRVFAHGANPQYNTSQPGLKDPIINSDTGTFDADFGTNGTTYSVNGLGIYKRENDPYSYASLSPTPEKEQEMLDGVSEMWASEPAWGPEAFAKIQCPTWIVDGDHDGAIPRNQADAMAAWTPYAGQVLLPQVGHECLLQDPKLFNLVMEYFLDQEFDGPRPVY